MKGATVLQAGMRVHQHNPGACWPPSRLLESTRDRRLGMRF